jgi:alpha-D-xyloside xylohydrolase
VVSLGLDVGELVYGLGERFGPLVKNGQAIDLWNEDAGTCTPYTYKNVPFYFTNRGYGVFFDHTTCVSLEVQTERLARVQVSVPGEQIRWYIIHGPTPKDILAKYTMLTGRAALPPPWSFGLYLSTSFLTDYSEKTVMAELDGMRDRGIPMSVFHFDCFWMKAHQWTNFTFDEEFFPDARAFLAHIHERGYKVCVWVNPYIAQDSTVFGEAAENGYLIRRSNGDVWQSDIWQAGMGVVDFTNPAAVAWYTANLQALLDIGVDSFKTDFGERIPWEDVQYHNGKDPLTQHNYFSYLYNRTVYEAIASKRGAHEAAVFARAATAGGQRLPVHWGGDCECTWNGMAQSLRGGLSLGMSGFGFYSHDIGGFMPEGQALQQSDAAIYKRWVQFGLLSSHSRLHGNNTSRAPWNVDEEACEVLKTFCELKNMLMPYLFAQAIDAKEKGLPLMRPMVVEFPDDKVCQSLDLQYMLGESLLVAPIFNNEGTCEYYVPSGTWCGLLDGKVRQGPGYYQERFDNFHLPLLVRENSGLAIGIKDKPDYCWEDSIEKIVLGACTRAALAVLIPSSSKLGEIDSALEVQIFEDGAGAVSGSKCKPKVIKLSNEEHL